MSDGFIKTALARHERAQARRANWERQWRDIADYMLPSHTPVLSEFQPGDSRTDKIYDGTATRMLRRQAATLMGLMTSPSSQWFSFTAKDGEGRPIENGDAARWLEGTADRLYAAFADSNFYSEIGEAYVDLIAFGTACPFVDERAVRGGGFNGFIFKNLAPGEFWIDEDDLGQVDTVIRCLPLDARRAVLKFGKDAVHSEINEDLKADGGAKSEWEFLHFVYRRGDPELGVKPEAGDRSYRSFPWQSCYLDKSHEETVEQGGFREQRYFPVRWSVASGEIYGRGPGFESLPDTKTLNQLAYWGLEAAALDIAPPWLGPDEGLLHRLRLKPFAYNVYDPDISGGADAFKPLRGNGNYRVEVERENALRQAIAQTFLDDLFTLREGGDITATEVLDRRERRQQVTSPVVSRLQTELLDPLVESCWGMMLRAGAFDRPPESLQGAERIDVDYVSPLSRAQGMGRTRALQDAFALIQPLAQARPDMLDHYDFDTLAREVPRDLGVPLDFLREEDAVAGMRKARAQQAQQRQAMEQGQELAQTAAKVAEVDNAA